MKALMSYSKKGLMRNRFAQVLRDLRKSKLAINPLAEAYAFVEGWELAFKEVNKILDKEFQQSLEDLCQKK